MAHKLQEKLFNCANLIDSLKCTHCIIFETHSWVHLKNHIKADHRLLILEEELHCCGKCSFSTYSRYLFSRHLFHQCGRDGKEKSEATVSERTNVKNESDRNDIASSMIERLKCKMAKSISAKSPYFDESQWLHCGHCSYKCKIQPDLKTHTKRHHDSSNYVKCPHCPFGTKFKQSLKKHILYKHANLEQMPWIKCPQCPYKSKWKYSVKRHIGILHNDKYSKCSYCPFQTKFKYNLRSHIKWKHTDLEKIQWLQCPHCSHKSRTKSNLKVHVDYNHKVDKHRFRCDQCSYECKWKYNLNKHIISMHSENYLKCEDCSYVTKSAQTLKRHNLSQHKDWEEAVVKEEIP